MIKTFAGACWIRVRQLDSSTLQSCHVDWCWSLAVTPTTTQLLATVPSATLTTSLHTTLLATPGSLLLPLLSLELTSAALVTRPCSLTVISTFMEDLTANLGKLSVFSIISKLFISIAYSRSDLLKYSPGKCGSRSNEGACSEGRPGVKCVWSEEGSCEIAGQGVGLGKAQCSTLHDVIRSEKCAMLDNCVACLHTSHSCVWCGGLSGSCNYDRCKETAQKVGATIRFIWLIHRFINGRGMKIFPTNSSFFI